MNCDKCLYTRGICCSTRFNLRLTKEEIETGLYAHTESGKLKTNKEGFCVYLSDDKKCNIHPFKPSVCSNYDNCEKDVNVLREKSK